MRDLHRLAAMAALGVLLASPFPEAGAADYRQTNLVSDVPGMAQVTDANLKNPWGVSFSSTSPFWVSNQATGTSSLFSVTGTTVNLPSPVPPGSTANFVNVPPQGNPPHGPTGQVSAGGAGFTIPSGNGGGSPAFIFSTLDGSIEGWVPGNMNARLGIQVPGAVFTGLTLGSMGGSNFLYAADSTGKIDVFDTGFNNVTNTTFAGKFTDPNPVAGFTPYNIELLHGMLFVAYALPNGAIRGPGGFIDEYDLSGNFIARLVTDTAGGLSGILNGPWGMAFAPANFGPASNDLLVGNFGNATGTGNNGTISVFSPTGTFLGQLSDATGTPFVNPGIWTLTVGNNGMAGSSDNLYFTAGINNQADGLLGVITFVPEPASAIQMSLAIVTVTIGVLIQKRVKRHRLAHN